MMSPALTRLASLLLAPLAVVHAVDVSVCPDRAPSFAWERVPLYIPKPKIKITVSWHASCRSQELAIDVADVLLDFVNEYYTKISFKKEP